MFLPGFPSSSAQYQPLIDRLSDRFRCIAPDYPGFGYSSTPPVDQMSTHVVHPPGVAALERWGLLDRLVATGCPPIDIYSPACRSPARCNSNHTVTPCRSTAGCS